MNSPNLTIFTPTYNRAKTLPRLFDSLKRQTCKDFEWLVINDGSTDSTSQLFYDWLRRDNGFPIVYVEVENGGKNRALNRGIRLAQGRLFMILDSDDLLTDDAVDFVVDAASQVATIPAFIGISGRRGDLQGRPLGCGADFKEEGYVDSSNLERRQYGLDRDMAEVFFTEKLRRYEFKVWPGEKFTPEEVVWNQMALDGYRLRWYNRVTYLCEYQEDGLTASSWPLLKANPMGYAMMFDQRMQIFSDIKSKMTNAVQYSCCCFLAKEYRMIVKSKLPLLTLLVSPLSWLVSRRRKRQFKSNI